MLPLLIADIYGERFIGILTFISELKLQFGERAEYCFESTVSEERTH